MLLVFLLQEMRELGYQQVQLVTSSAMRTALRLYRRHFEESNPSMPMAEQGMCNKFFARSL